MQALLPRGSVLHLALPGRNIVSQVYAALVFTRRCCTPEGAAEQVHFGMSTEAGLAAVREMTGQASMFSVIVNVVRAAGTLAGFARERNIAGSCRSVFKLRSSFSIDFKVEKMPDTRVVILFPERLSSVRSVRPAGESFKFWLRRIQDRGIQCENHDVCRLLRRFNAGRQRIWCRLGGVFLLHRVTR